MVQLVQAKKRAFFQVGLLLRKQHSLSPKPPYNQTLVPVQISLRTSPHSLSSCPATKNVSKKLYHPGANQVDF